jgi:hypothetical protein
VPDHLTRLKAVEASAANFAGEVLLMDTAPAAVLGALLDPAVSAHQQSIVCNVGNFHTLAFRLGPGGIAGVFEHHTGEITREQLDGFIARMMTGALEHRGFRYDGPRRADVRSAPVTDRFVACRPAPSLLRDSTHHPYFAVPLGDMMIAGCFGRCAATPIGSPSMPRRSRSLRGSIKPAVWSNCERVASGQVGGVCFRQRQRASLPTRRGIAVGRCSEPAATWEPRACGSPVHGRVAARSGCVSGTRLRVSSCSASWVVLDLA